MAIIAPVGNKEFNWSPKETVLSKTASTGTKAQETDKDALFTAAKNFLGKKAQFNFDTIKDKEDDKEVKDEACEPCLEPTTQVGEIAKEVDAGADAQKAVSDLVDKANKAQEVVEKVEEAVAKVEEAVQEVKNAVGAEIEAEVAEEKAEGEIPEEVEIEITDDEEETPAEDTEVVEDAAAEKDEDKEIEIEDGEGKKEDEIVQESCMANTKVQMKTAGDADGMVRIAKLSPSVKKKVLDYWKNELGYVPDFCKLLVQDN